MAQRRTEEGKKKRRAYIKKYAKENYRHINLTLRPDEKDNIVSTAESYDLSISRLCISAVEEYKEHHPQEEKDN